LTERSDNIKDGQTVLSNINLRYLGSSDILGDDILGWSPN